MIIDEATRIVFFFFSFFFCGVCVFCAIFSGEAVWYGLGGVKGAMERTPRDGIYRSGTLYSGLVSTSIWAFGALKHVVFFTSRFRWIKPIERQVEYPKGRVTYVYFPNIVPRVVEIS